ncbi:bifunctional lysylphosphatidylglycerol flippase/synthetase MprF [Rhodococcus tibetensis]|uniref:DUF2156 domain-containing protein n=1 Tax=Rhodococcus tibetensis TaxID=2965064 RepID=A0ABT1Q9K9_9NOCA|nr:DUF2156 domain-containing protein [Rhodococcus sp. FXJ9.536]MCQ4118937.1 DUF2156 domain-containing protein [Rhodococcus sp. FXJ9.536]
MAADADPPTEAHEYVVRSAHRLVSAYSENPSAFNGLSDRNDYYFGRHCDGVVAYRNRGHSAVIFGGPICAPEARAALLEEFSAHCASHRRRIVAIQVGEQDADAYAQLGFRLNQIGSSYAVDLRTFGLTGKRFVKLRNKISRARRAGVEVHERVYDDVARDIDRIDTRWLWAMEHGGDRELDFLTGSMGDTLQAHRRLFVAEMAGRPIGYVSYSPSYGARTGWLHDLTRRVPTSPPGTMELINVTAMNTFHTEDVRWLHFGFTPFVDLSPANDVERSSPIMKWAIGMIAEHGSALYPGRSQVEYKTKWGTEPASAEYIAFRGMLSPLDMVNALRVTGVV